MTVSASNIRSLHLRNLVGLRFHSTSYLRYLLPSLKINYVYYNGGQKQQETEQSLPFQQENYLGEYVDRNQTIDLNRYYI